ncbi:hypothetical protein [Actinocorallia longicatena]|uniref:Uncharacterized protein n=1 Tax=Actinocorallia longicatena TaxID=111803 RepID=A0ABP6Q6N9_9ACTN
MSSSGASSEQNRTDAERIAELQAEISTLHHRLGARERRRTTGLAVRRFAAALLVALAGFGFVCSAIGVWAARTVLDTDRWVATVDGLPAHPEVTSAVSVYLTDEVFGALNVQERLAEALPPRAAFLAVPVSGAVKDYTRDTVREFMGTERFHGLWREANRFAQKQIVAIVRDDSGTVAVDGSTVTVDLLPIVNALLLELENRLPSLFGKRLDLPEVGSGQIPAGLRQRVESALGVTLPADFARVTFYDRDRLGELQEGVLVFKRSLALIVALTLACLGLALVVSPGRRRTLLQFGLWLAIAVVVQSAVLRAVRDELLGMISDDLDREAVAVALREVLSSLRRWGDVMFWSGLAIAVAAYLAGPGRGPVALRDGTRAGARGLWTRGRAVATGPRLRTGVRRHTDALRVGGAAAAALLALLFSSWGALLVLLILLAAYELLIELLLRRAGPAG